MHAAISSLTHHGCHRAKHHRHSVNVEHLASLGAIEKRTKTWRARPTVVLGFDQADNACTRHRMRLHPVTLQNRCANEARRVVPLGGELQRALAINCPCLRQQPRELTLQSADVQHRAAHQSRMHLPHLPRAHNRLPRPSTRIGWSNLRAIFGATVVASILTLAVGCDKRGAAEIQQTSLAGKPRAVLLLFGDRTDPRVLPLATVSDGQIKPISLDADGWRNFDKLYFTAGAALALYQDGKAVGNAVVRRGMWLGRDALYRLPNCRALRPLAAVTVDSTVNSAVMLELISTSDPLAPAPPRGATTEADADSARVLTARIAQHEGLTNAARGELSLIVNAIQTGATAHPTLVGSYLERGSGVTGKPRHVLAIGDYTEATRSYTQSFVHVPGDTAREFRRFIDHVDLTGDGIDEIVLEGWRTGGDSFLVFMQYKDNHWREVARGANNWCADPGGR